LTPTEDSVPLGVFGEKAIWAVGAAAAPAVVLETFDDGTPAELRFPVGEGADEVTAMAYHPGLSYFHPATLRRPVDRSPHPKAFTNFVPTEFAVRGRAVLAQPLAGVAGAVPVRYSESLVESGHGLSAARATITLVTWAENSESLDAPPSLRATVELAAPLPGCTPTAATLASCGTLPCCVAGGCGARGSRLNATADMRSFSVIGIADAIILL
jgi:hypothetical protein